MRLEVRRDEVLGSKEAPEGHTAKVKVVKNKVAAPFKTAYFDIYSDDRGIDTTSKFIDTLVELKVLQKSGSWLYYPSKEKPETISGIECKWGSKPKAAEDFRKSRELYDYFRKIFAEIAIQAEDNDEIEGDNMTDEEIEQAVVAEVEAEKEAS